MVKKIDLSADELNKIAIYLQKNIGVYLEESKLQRFKRKIEDIFYKYSIESFSSFYHQLRFIKNEDIIQDLINTVTVNETYFWRENEQFEVLNKDVLPKFIKQNSLTNVRILVAPCSSGEELYSIMISILEAGDLIDRLNIEIVGMDIDSQMIKKAKSGLYSKRSIEKLPKNILDKYFDKVGNMYKINETLIKAANFIKENIFNPALGVKLGEFDIIFSRNMLIYFKNEDKQKCYTIFYTLLKKEGYLFLGHADANNIDKKLFSPIKIGFHIFKKIP